MREITTRQNRYNSKRVRIINEEPSRTQQQFQDEVNINNIMKKYRQTGMITHINVKQGKFTEGLVPDTHTSTTYLDAMNVITDAHSQFEAMPSHLRQKFENNPAKFLEFIHDEKNFDEAVKLGIFNPKDTTVQNQITKNQNAVIKQQNDDLNDDTPPTPAPTKSKK